MPQTLKVYEAITAIQAALAKDGIAKSRKNSQQGYNFRGIDDVYNALSPLLAEHKLCILPRVLSRECMERQTKTGSPLFYSVVDVEFDMVSAEDGSKHTIRTFGEAMDSADKSTNKAMSAAYKYAAMQAFAIPTEGDNDADATTHEVAARSNGAVKRNVSPKSESATDARAARTSDVGEDAAIAYVSEWQTYLANEDSEQAIRATWAREKPNRAEAGITEAHAAEMMQASRARIDEIRKANILMAG